MEKMFGNLGLRRICFRTNKLLLLLGDLSLRIFTLFSSLQANLSNANLEGALATGNTSFKGSNITGAGMPI